MQEFKNVVVLTKEEYDALSDPDKTYTLMTKTSAKRAVRNLLKAMDFVCWHDNQAADGDGACSLCPVYTHLGYDAADRMCDKGKSLSK